MKAYLGRLAVCCHGSLGIIDEVVKDMKSGTIIKWKGRKLDGSNWESNNPRFLDENSEDRLKHLFESLTIFENVTQ